MKSKTSKAVVLVVLALLLVVLVARLASRPRPQVAPAPAKVTPQPDQSVPQPAQTTPQPAETTQQEAKAVPQPAGRTLIEFDITQDKNIISLATFSEPPQFAIWLEDPDTHKYKTIFVAYRSGTGDMVGKAECPGCLPLWFEIYERETGKKGYPKPDDPAPAAVTGATPQDENFKITREIERGSKCICWIEMNLAGDFNADHQEFNAEKKTVDDDFSGQPALVYRCEIEAIPGNKYVPQLFGQVVMNKPLEEMIQPVTSDITSAKEVFKSIQIRITESEPNQPK